MRDGNHVYPIYDWAVEDIVLRLPMRDGNLPVSIETMVGTRVLRLPMRDGNSPSMSQAPTPATSS